MPLSIAFAANDHSTWPALYKTVHQTAVFWQHDRQELSRFIRDLQLMSAAPAAIIGNHGGVSRQSDDRRSDLELFRIHQIPRRRFRTQLLHSHGLLQQLRRNLCRNLFRADFVFCLFGRWLKQAVGLIHQYPEVALTGQCRRSPRGNHDVRHIRTDHSISGQWQTGRSQHKQTIGHRLLKLHDDACLAVAEDFPSHPALARHVERHHCRDASRQLDREMVGGGSSDLPVECECDLNGGFSDVGDRHGFADQCGNCLAQFDRQVSRSHGVTLKGQGRCRRSDFSKTGIRGGGGFHGPVTAIFHSCAFRRGIEPYRQFRCRLRGVHHGGRLQLQRGPIGISICLPLDRDLQQAAVRIAELNTECSMIGAGRRSTMHGDSISVAIHEIPVFEARGRHVEGQKSLRDGDVNPGTRCPGNSQSDAATPQLPLFLQTNGVHGFDRHFIGGRSHFHCDGCRMTRVSPRQHRSPGKFIAFWNRSVAGIDLSNSGERIRTHLKLRSRLQNHCSQIATGSAHHRDRNGQRCECVGRGSRRIELHRQFCAITDGSSQLQLD